MIDNVKVESTDSGGKDDINEIFTSPFMGNAQNLEMEIKISKEDIFDRIIGEITTNQEILEVLADALVERIIENPLLLGKEILNNKINETVINHYIDDLLTKINPMIKEALNNAIHSAMFSE